MKKFKLVNGETVTLTQVQNKLQNELVGEFSLKDARKVLHEFYDFLNEKEFKKAVYHSVQDNKLENIYRVKYGTYSFTDDVYSSTTPTVDDFSKVEHAMPKNEIIEFVTPDVKDMNLIPLKSPEFVPHGCYNIVRTVISKNIFAPVWIAGESGNGKTFGVEQACAAEKRELVILNMSNETTEEDLIGSYILKNGDMIWQDGPVVLAMRRGAVLCLDEIDQARSSIMALNTIAQGKPYYIKKTNELVIPKKGFTLIGTANTKGDGSGMDKFTGAQIMNEAFLERFAIIVEQDYPDKKTETKILQKHSNNKNFISTLIDIAYAVRQSYANGDLDIVLTTRRLVQIAKNFEIFKNETQAINLAIARFSTEDQDVIKELYNALVAEHKKREKELEAQKLRAAAEKELKNKPKPTAKKPDESTSKNKQLNAKFWLDETVVSF